MSRRPLGPEERAAWDRLKATVKPLHPVRAVSPAITVEPAPLPKPITRKGRVPPPPAARPAPPPAATPITPGNLDSHWDRRLKRGSAAPDFHLDLHGMNLTHAYDRLDGALEQAVATGARTILLVTGRARGHDRAGGEGRGAIRAAVHDWLSASRHAGHIAAVRNAHPRHGGEGALYIILKRGR